MDEKVKEEKKVKEVYKLGKICLARIIDEETGESALITPKPEGLTDKDWELLKRGGNHVRTSKGYYNLMPTLPEVEKDPWRDCSSIKRVIYVNF